MSDSGPVTAAGRAFVTYLIQLAEDEGARVTEKDVADYDRRVREIEVQAAAAPDMAQERARALAITFRDEWRKAVADRTSRFSDLEERVSLARNALFDHLDAAPAASDGIAATGLAARTEAALLLELLNELHYRRGRFAKVTVDDVMGALEFVRDPRTAARLAATPAESGAGEL